jgi:DNA-binding transcriptional regulator YiaG
LKTTGKSGHAWRLAVRATGKSAKAAPACEPLPTDIRAAREAAGLTQAGAAALLYKTTRVWQMWEAGDRGMDPAFWELFRIKVAAQPDESSQVAGKG